MLFIETICGDAFAQELCGNVKKNLNLDMRARIYAPKTSFSSLLLAHMSNFNFLFTFPQSSKADASSQIVSINNTKFMTTNIHDQTFKLSQKGTMVF